MIIEDINDISLGLICIWILLRLVTHILPMQFSLWDMIIISYGHGVLQHITGVL